MTYRQAIVGYREMAPHYNLRDSGTNKSNLVSNFLRHEFSHRINNQLQILLNYLKIIMNLSKVGKAEALNNAGLFIHSMAELRNEFYRQPSATGVEARSYFSAIGNNPFLMRPFGCNAEAELDIQACKSPIEIAQQLGLLLSELVTSFFRKIRIPGYTKNTHAVTKNGNKLEP